MIRHVRSLRAARHITASIVLIAVALLVPACSGGTKQRRAGAPRSRPAHAAPSWQHTLGAWPSKIVADHRSIVVTWGAGRVTDLDFDGRRRWTATLDGDQYADPGISSTTVVAPTRRGLASLDREDGTRRWQVDVAGTVSAIALVDAPSGEARVVDSTRDGVLEGRHAADGSILWQSRDNRSVGARVVFSDDRRLAIALWRGAESSVLRAHDVDSGAVVWEREVARAASAPAITHGLVVLGAGDDHFRSQALAFSVGDGAPMSSASLPGSFGSSTEPGVAGVSVVLVDQLGTASMVDMLHGRLEWQTKLDAPVIGERPIVGDDVVVLTTYSRELVWLDRHTGRILNRFDAGGVLAGAAAGEGQVVVGLRWVEPPRVQAYPL